LTVWFETIWLMSVPANGVSAQTLYRVLPIGSYQTAWAMLGKLRAAMSSLDKAKLAGTVEVDEWYHGGVAKGGSSLTRKNLVAAAVEHTPGGRGIGRIRLRGNRPRHHESRTYWFGRSTFGLSFGLAALAGSMRNP
jgi:hypothetical protein